MMEAYLIRAANPGTYGPKELSTGDTVSLRYGQKLKAVGWQPNIGGFKLVFDNARIRATREAKEAVPTLNVICSMVERENFVRIRSSKIANLLSVSIPTVERHLAKLKKLGLLEPDPFEADKKAGIVCWRVCPFLSWRGDSASLVTYLKTLAQDHLWQKYND